MVSQEKVLYNQLIQAKPGLEVQAQPNAYFDQLP